MRLLLATTRGITTNVRTNVRRRHGGSMLGPIWYLATPVLQLGIMGLMYVVVLGVSPPGVDRSSYVLMVLMGLALAISSTKALAQAPSYIKMNKSRIVNWDYPVDNAIAEEVLTNVVPYYATGLAVSVAATLLFGSSAVSIAGFALAALFAVWMLMSVSTILAYFGTVSKGLADSMTLVTMLLFITSPFAYTPEMVPSRLAPLVLANPLSSPILVMQGSTLEGVVPLIPVVLSILWSILFFAIAWRFRRTTVNVMLDAL